MKLTMNILTKLHDHGYARKLRGYFVAPRKEDKHVDFLHSMWNYVWATRRPYPSGEATLAADAIYAYCYAKYILKGRFPLGEKAIAQDGRHSCNYVLKLPEAQDFDAWHRAHMPELNTDGIYELDEDGEPSLVRKDELE